MAWTSPRTWVTSELVTAAIMNTHIRDNLRELWREIESVGPSSQVSNTSQDTPNATLVLALTARAYTGLPIEIQFRANEVREAQTTDGGWTLGLWDGTISGHTPNVRVLGKGTGVQVGSGLWSYRFTPSVATHTYSVALSSGNGTGTDVAIVAAGAFLRLLERGG